MATLLVITNADEATPLVRWAARFAKARSGSLHVLCCFAGEPVLPRTPVSPEDLENGEDLLRTAARAVDELGDGTVELHQLRHPDPAIAVLEAVEAPEIDLVVIGTDGRLPPGAPEHRLGDRLLRFAPCDVLLIDPGDAAGTSCDRVLVPMGGTLSPFAVRAAARLVSESGVVMPFHVGTEFGADSKEVALRELAMDLRQAGVAPSGSIQPTVVVADRLLDGTLTASRSCDLVLVGATVDRDLRNLRAAEAASGPVPEGSRVAMGVIRPARVQRTGLWAAIAEHALPWIPKLEPADRVELFDRLQAGARWNADFTMMIGLSSMIAALGLLLNSTAVVIGAMVVAPLMTPLIGSGLALIQGNFRLFRGSIQAMALGVITGLGVSLFMGLVTPQADLTIELISRGAPTVLDLVVAFLSGMAAAYALARPTLMGTLAGVAIAAALVPPLATVGITLARWALMIAEGSPESAMIAGFILGVGQGAAMLLLANLVAIIVGAAFVFRALGVQGTRLGIGPSLWARRAVLGLILLAILLIATLGYRTGGQLYEYQIRPMAFPISDGLYKTLSKRVKKEPHVSIMMAGRSGLIEDPAVGIILSASKPVARSLEEDLKRIIHARLGEDTNVEIFVLRDAWAKPPVGDAKARKK